LWLKIFLDPVNWGTMQQAGTLLGVKGRWKESTRVEGLIKGGHKKSKCEGGWRGGKYEPGGKKGGGGET